MSREKEQKEGQKKAYFQRYEWCTMKTFMQHITEDGIEIGPMLRRAVSSRARKLKRAKDKRISPVRKSEVKWREAEAKLNRDMGWTTATNADT